MFNLNNFRTLIPFLFVLIVILPVSGQHVGLKWSSDGNAYYRVEGNEIVQYALPDNTKSYLVHKEQLIPAGTSSPLSIKNYSLSSDGTKVLIYTNTQRVWRINTRGDYWVLDLSDNSLKQLGTSRPPSSLMFAKFSPDSRNVAYVSEDNIYVEDLQTHTIKALTTNGTRKFINGTFDWAYEEEFACRDGIRWSPDSKSIAYWQIDARDIRDFYLINNTDSIYPFVIPVEYPIVGQDPSACRLGVVDIATATTTWLQIPGDPRQHYIVRMEYIPGTNDLLIQQLNRKQNASKLIRYNTTSGMANTIFSERDSAWIDVLTPWTEHVYSVDFKYNFEWLQDGKDILWASEQDGWRHLYRVPLTGKKAVLVTPGNYDVIVLKGIDEANGVIYFLASPDNATQRYLFRTTLDGKDKRKQLTPAEQAGTHDYTISPNTQYAVHSFSSCNTLPMGELISLPEHQPLDPGKSIAVQLANQDREQTTEFFRITTEDSIEMDGWMVKPKAFDPSKKYPVVFFVYTEPWQQTVVDAFGASYNFLYAGDMRKDGYIYISIDNRGTPAPKGAAWRKAIYRNVGIINIHDQAMAARQILKWPFVDSSRIAVWGWSGGAAATLNLLFQYPEIYQTGIAIAAVTNLLTYDNIYQERYMGLPQENMEDYIKGSPVTYADGLQGNLLYIHGTGDDNVHYQNAELLLNALIKYNKQFQFMAYPNRTHSISEGEGTSAHLSTLYTTYLKEHCPPGGR